MRQTFHTAMAGADHARHANCSPVLSVSAASAALPPTSSAQAVAGRGPTRHGCSSRSAGRPAVRACPVCTRCRLFVHVVTCLQAGLMVADCCVVTLVLHSCWLAELSSASLPPAGGAWSEWLAPALRLALAGAPLGERGGGACYRFRVFPKHMLLYAWMLCCPAQPVNKCCPLTF